MACGWKSRRTYPSLSSKKDFDFRSPLLYHAGPMALTSPKTPAAPAPSANHSPPLSKRRELARADVNAELTRLLLHGFGTLTVKIHNHRVTSLECTTRMLEGKADEA
jgi:hypothetical protein